jgi:hypothetical protein
MSVMGILLAQHGFLRAQNGAITVFDVPGATFTIPSSINPAGTIAGTFVIAGVGVHGFLRAPNGTITVIDAPGSGITRLVAINPAGTIVGRFIPADSGQGIGFVSRPENMH